MSYVQGDKKNIHDLHCSKMIVQRDGVTIGGIKLGL